MSGEMMNFPDTAEEFMKQYKIVDSEEVYTNGAELVPIFRMKQWFEQHPEPHWIPWTGECDLMDNEEVLVCQKDGQIRHAMFYDFNGKKKFVTWEEGITIYDVLAYMPLPEPYKGVTK